jgi:SAM-dependent methyltransferase
MLQQFLTFVSRVPRLWNGLRWIAEAGYRSHYLTIDATLNPSAGVGTRFLDLGCGTGQFAGSFPAERYVGVDPTRPYIDYAAQHHAGAFTVMDGSVLGLADDAFDGALVLGVFHHLSDAIVRAGVAELHRVLKPDGTLLVVEDIPPPSPWNVPGRLMHWLDRGDYIRSDADYRALFAPYFAVASTYAMRSGICDYQVYQLRLRTQTESP